MTSLSAEIALNLHSATTQKVAEARSLGFTFIPHHAIYPFILTFAANQVSRMKGSDHTQAHRKITAHQVKRLSMLYREARWSFPSSMGNPVRQDPETMSWINRVMREQESLVEAASFLVQKGEEDAAMEVAANTWRLWIISKDIDGGRKFLASILDHAKVTPSRHRALALYGDGLLALKQGRLEESKERNRVALDTAKMVDDPEALALSSLGLSRIAFDEGRYEDARSLASDAREYCRELDESIGQAPLHLQAQSNRMLGDYDKAAALLTESLELNRRIGDKGMVTVELHNLGHVEAHRGKFETAKAYFTEAEETGTSSDPYTAAMTRLNKASIAFGRGKDDEARASLQDSETILKHAGIEAAHDDKFEIDWLRDRLQKLARHGD